MAEKNETLAHQVPVDLYVQGFNEGYTIAEHLPTLADELSKAVSDTPRGIGFVHGRDQYIAEQHREQQKDRRPDWLRGAKEGLSSLFGDGKDKSAAEPKKEQESDRDVEPER